MPREPRIEVPGGIYHVSSKGNRGCVVFEDDFERRTFLKLLSLVTRRCGWACHSFCLMSNHFHLLVQLDIAGLSAGMQQLNGSFARFSNKRHGNVGHLFRNRFWSEEIATDSHLLEAARYIVLNPVRAGICARPGDWAWSSYRSCAGLDFAPRFLAATQHLRLFASNPSAAQKAYRDFVHDGIGAPSPRVRHSDEVRLRSRRD
ncbi:MAG TPA: transposase [Gaiellaceae bacterium]|nr:transposase [Gaiellaceae bacterium]